MEKCCELDTNGDGNCPTHASPGVLRNPIKGFHLCNRSVCLRPLPDPPRWFNKSTQRFYCQSCMLKITDWPENKDIFEDRNPGERT